MKRRLLGYAHSNNVDREQLFMKTDFQRYRARLCAYVVSAGALLSIVTSVWAGVPVEAIKLVAEEAADNDFFGFSVALSGDTALIGAMRDDDGGEDAGAVYVFTRLEGGWKQQGKLTAPDAAAGDELGGSVGFADDVAAAGARLSDGKSADSGSAYVFTRSAGEWNPPVKLVAADGAAGDEFGYGVAVSGTTVVVAAPRDDDKYEDSGSVYVFTRSGSHWNQQAKLTADDGAEGDLFGISVAIDDDTIVVGADLTDDKGENSGAAYVFTRSGDSWSQQAKLTADDGAAGDLFGIRVTVSGETAVIGAARDDDQGENSGAAYVFVRDGMTWSQQAKLTADDGAANDRFGTRVEIQGDTAVIAAILGDGAAPDVGAAYVFTRSANVWAQHAKLAASDGASGDVFGWGVALDGDTVLAGAPTSIITLPGGPGSAYLFELDRQRDKN